MSENYNNYGMHRNNSEVMLIVSLSLWIAFLTVELIARMRDWYYFWPYIDIVSHLLSGLAVGASAFWFFNKKSMKYRQALSILVSFLAAILWEIVEMTGELVFPDVPHLRDYFFWDGFFDILFALIGTLIFLVMVRHVRKRYINH